MAEYLDTTGLTHLWGKITGKINEVKTDVYDLHSAATISVSPKVIERGVSTDVTVAWATTYKGEKVTPVSTDVSKGGEAYSSINTTPNSSQKVSLSATTNFKNTSVIIEGVSKTATATVTAVYPMYFGGNAATSLASADVLALTKQTIKTSPNGDYEVPVTAGQYMWLCVPSGMTISKVTSSGFSVPMEPVATVTVTGKGTYNCYRSSSTYTAQTVKITIAQ